MQSQAKIDRNMLLLDAQALLLQWKSQVAPGVSLTAVADLDAKWSQGIHREFLELLNDGLGTANVTPARFPPGLAWQALDTLLELKRVAEAANRHSAGKGKEKTGGPPRDDRGGEKGADDDRSEFATPDVTVDDDDSEADEGSFIVHDDDDADSDADDPRAPAFMAAAHTFATPGEFRDHLREKTPLRNFIRSSRQQCGGFVARSIDLGAIPADDIFLTFSADEITGELVNDGFNTKYRDPALATLILADSEKPRLDRILATQRQHGRRRRLHELDGQPVSREPEHLREEEREDPEAELSNVSFRAIRDEDAGELRRLLTFRRGKGRTRVLLHNRVIGLLPRKRQHVRIETRGKFITYKVVEIGGEHLTEKSQMPLMISARGRSEWAPFVGVTELKAMVAHTETPVRCTIGLVVESTPGNVLGSEYPRVLLAWQAQPTEFGGAAPHAAVGGRIEIDLVNRTLKAADPSTEKYFGQF